MLYLTIAEIQSGQFPTVVDVTMENGWTVVWLKGTIRLKFK